MLAKRETRLILFGAAVGMGYVFLLMGMYPIAMVELLAAGLYYLVFLRGEI